MNVRCFRCTARCWLLCVWSLAVLAGPLSADWPEVGSNDFRISFDTDTNPMFGAWRPIVIFDPLREEYLSVWNRQIGALDEFLAQRLDSSGLPLGPVQVVGSDSTPGRIAGEFAPEEDRYLVVWSSVLDLRVRGRLLTGTAGAASGILDLSPVCSDFAVGPSCHIAVAYNGLDREFLVVFNRYFEGPPASRALYGQLVDAASGLQSGGSFPSMNRWMARTISRQWSSIPPVSSTSSSGSRSRRTVPSFVASG